MKTKPESLASRVRRLRDLAGLTQFELAVAADVAHATVSAIEQGRRCGSARTCRKLAKALGVEPEELRPSGLARRS
jgi:transcriptional regulator with XRE-family HTH domain